MFGLIRNNYYSGPNLVGTASDGDVVEFRTALGVVGHQCGDGSCRKSVTDVYNPTASSFSSLVSPSAVMQNASDVSSPCGGTTVALREWSPSFGSPSFGQCAPAVSGVHNVSLLRQRVGALWQCPLGDTWEPSQDKTTTSINQSIQDTSTRASLCVSATTAEDAIGNMDALSNFQKHVAVKARSDLVAEPHWAKQCRSLKVQLGELHEQKRQLEMDKVAFLARPVSLVVSDDKPKVSLSMLTQEHDALCQVYQVEEQCCLASERLASDIEAQLADAQHDLEDSLRLVAALEDLGAQSNCNEMSRATDDCGFLHIVTEIRRLRGELDMVHASRASQLQKLRNIDGQVSRGARSLGNFKEDVSVLKRTRALLQEENRRMRDNLEVGRRAQNSAAIDLEDARFSAAAAHRGGHGYLEELCATCYAIEDDLRDRCARLEVAELTKFAISKESIEMRRSIDDLHDAHCVLLERPRIESAFRTSMIADLRAALHSSEFEEVAGLGMQVDAAIRDLDRFKEQYSERRRWHGDGEAGLVLGRSLAVKAEERSKSLISEMHQCVQTLACELGREHSRTTELLHAMSKAKCVTGKPGRGKAPRRSSRRRSASATSGRSEHVNPRPNHIPFAHSVTRVASQHARTKSGFFK